MQKKIVNNTQFIFKFNALMLKLISKEKLKNNKCDFSSLASLNSMLRRVATLGICASVTACAPEQRTASYYDDLQTFYLLSGGMRTERAPQDAPFTKSDLVRNFESIAFHTEFNDKAKSLAESKTPTTLVKWRGEVTYDVFGDAATAEDEEDLRNLTNRLATLTGLQFRRVSKGAKIIIMIANQQARIDFVRALTGLGMGDQIQIIREWSKNGRFPCVAQIGDLGGANGHGLVAIIGIKGETHGLLRKSCIHEEFVQSLGLMNDDSEIRPSIFNDDEEFALLTAHDEYLLRILYDPRMRHGMTAEEGMPIVRKIASEIGPDD